MGYLDEEIIEYTLLYYKKKPYFIDDDNVAYEAIDDEDADEDCPEDEAFKPGEAVGSFNGLKIVLYKDAYHNKDDIALIKEFSKYQNNGYYFSYEIDSNKLIREYRKLDKDAECIARKNETLKTVVDVVTTTLETFDKENKELKSDVQKLLLENHKLKMNSVFQELLENIANVDEWDLIEN